MLPPLLLRATDRLTDVVMAIIRVVGPFGTNPANPDEPAQHARTLLYRLTDLLVRLVRLSNNPLPTPRHSADLAPLPNQPAPTSISSRTSPLVLPRRPGWLLALLPDDTPALAAQLRAALADPALAPLLGAVPTLAHDLRPLFNALGLDAPALPPPDLPPPTLPPDVPPLGTPLANPPPSHRPASICPASTRPIAIPALNRSPHPAPRYAQYITV